eukprot:1253634-Karenia_brevis.AAC.1
MDCNLRQRIVHSAQLTIAGCHESWVETALPNFSGSEWAARNFTTSRCPPRNAKCNWLFNLGTSTL